VLFRGGKGDDLRYAHASSSNVADEDYPWVRFDITVSDFDSSQERELNFSPTDCLAI
jgi:hypothetical protein